MDNKSKVEAVLDLHPALGLNGNWRTYLDNPAAIAFFEKGRQQLLDNSDMIVEISNLLKNVLRTRTIKNGTWYYRTVPEFEARFDYVHAGEFVVAALLAGFYIQDAGIYTDEVLVNINLADFKRKAKEWTAQNEARTDKN
jgi:hypothetical protein